jgi:hypothetical protein
MTKRSKKTQDGRNEARTRGRRRQRRAGATAPHAGKATLSTDGAGAEPVTKRLRKIYDGETPRPSWSRYYQAYVTLLEDGNPVTETAIARVLGISRMSLWRIHRRNPGLRRWVHEQLRDGNEYLVGPVVRMLGTTAVRTKSPKHAELFLKAVGAIGAREDGGGGETGACQMVINSLVPFAIVPPDVQEQAQRRLPPPLAAPFVPVPPDAPEQAQRRLRPPPAAFDLPAGKVPLVNTR